MPRSKAFDAAIVAVTFPLAFGAMGFLMGGVSEGFGATANRYKAMWAEARELTTANHSIATLNSYRQKMLSGKEVKASDTEACRAAENRLRGLSLMSRPDAIIHGEVQCPTHEDFQAKGPSAFGSPAKPQPFGMY